MDRLHPVIALLACLVATGCDDPKPSSDAPKKTETKSRVNAVQAKKPAPAPAPADFCDVYHEADAAPFFEYPPLAGEEPSSPEGWRWVNLWATWCKPCVEEMPRLSAWEKELSGDGLGDVVFISADESDALVTKFRADHPETPGGPRLESPEVMNEWLAAMGLTGAASLPAHVFVDSAKKTRCVRVGGISENDRAAVERLLNER